MKRNEEKLWKAKHIAHSMNLYYSTPFFGLNVVVAIGLLDGALVGWLTGWLAGKLVRYSYNLDMYGWIICIEQKHSANKLLICIVYRMCCCNMCVCMWKKKYFAFGRSTPRILAHWFFPKPNIETLYSIDSFMFMHWLFPILSAYNIVTSSSYCLTLFYPFYTFYPIPLHLCPVQKPSISNIIQPHTHSHYSFTSSPTMLWYWFWFFGFYFS